ncbi:MAG: hypothetical protein J0H74_28515 [Chitinophagaceae bacterium]|nr:hypothetical protein [Chitinophagaceae bacterium]
MEKNTSISFEKFTEGSLKEFAVVYDQFYPQVFYLTLRFGVNIADAEDITKETFIKLFRLRDQIGSESEIRAFLFISARNSCIDYLRHSTKKRQSFEK